MSGLVLLVLSALRLSESVQNHTRLSDDIYYELPRFWTNVGFCPAGDINHGNITADLLSAAQQMNLRHIGALPVGAVTHVRIHWLLELIEFIAYTEAGVPIYDFTQLDAFMDNLSEFGLQPVVEFMGNPGDVFTQNPNKNKVLWEHLAYQLAHRYLTIFSAKGVANWRFETWNEPDLLSYNKLNFTFEAYLSYVVALRQGLTAAAQRSAVPLHFPLHGPAGLFKSEERHPFCWKMLQHCHEAPTQCPLDALTFHRKGHGEAYEVLNASTALLQVIYQRFPNLKTFPIANTEADPIAIWSQPQDFHADVRYAVLLVNIVLQHWSAKLQRSEFRNFAYLSHDNAFLSYHPHEFSQRTLLAHFRMNNTQPPHSQFVQKPVYAALGLLSKLAPLAADVELLPRLNDSVEAQLWKTSTAASEPMYLSWLLLPAADMPSQQNFTLQRRLLLTFAAPESFAFGVELLAQQLTDPALLWRQNGHPPYPKATLRAAMRHFQTPRLHTYGILTKPQLELHVPNLPAPWLMLVRVCSNFVPRPHAPLALNVVEVTLGEVQLSWKEVAYTTRCLKTYEVWFQANTSVAWTWISSDWHLPFPSFQYAPESQLVSGFYKIRSQDLFDEFSAFSQIVEYYEL